MMSVFFRLIILEIKESFLKISPGNSITTHFLSFIIKSITSSNPPRMILASPNTI